MTTYHRRKPGPVPIKNIPPSQLVVEWKRLGRRAVRLWRESGGLNPEIDILFKRMDAADRALAKTSRVPRHQRRATTPR